MCDISSNSYYVNVVKTIVNNQKKEQKIVEIFAKLTKKTFLCIVNKIKSTPVY